MVTTELLAAVFGLALAAISFLWALLELRRMRAELILIQRRFENSQEAAHRDAYDAGYAQGYDDGIGEARPSTDASTYPPERKG